MFALIFPLVLALAWRVFKKRQWIWGIVAVALGMLALLPHFWLKSEITRSTLAHNLASKWTPVSLFCRTFSNDGILHYTLPNGLYIFSPACHPYYLLLLPLLFFLVKRLIF